VVETEQGTEAEPAHVTLLLDFLNTIDVEQGQEELPDDRALTSWLRAHSLPTRGADAAEARAVRDTLRSAADGTPLKAGALATVPLQVTISDDAAPTLTSRHPLGPVLVAAMRLALSGEWSRIKLCHMHDCRYAFYDTSRNRAGRWCSMRVCGNRAKTRAFRERQRG
jgi:hypothetical protein